MVNLLTKNTNLKKKISHNKPSISKPLTLRIISKFLRLLCAAQKLSHISPCLYPVYRESQACGVQDFSLLDGFFCDPDSTVSMSEGSFVLFKNINMFWGSVFHSKFELIGFEASHDDSNLEFKGGEKAAVF